MKWNGTGRSIKVLGVSLAVGLGMTACSRDYTVAYLYATSATRNQSGVVNAYAVDYQTGAIAQLSDSPIPLNGQNPVTVVAGPNGKTIYVIDKQSSQIEVLGVGTDGKLYNQPGQPVVQNSAKTVFGSNPTWAAVDPTGSFLYVTFAYQSGFTPALPGPGGFAIYPISATDGSLGAPLSNTTLGGATTANPLPYFPVGNNPAGIFVSVSNYIYIVDDETTSAGAPQGVLLVFKASSATSGATPTITQVTGPVLGGFSSGTRPAAVAVDPTGAYIYVTDSATNQMYGYSNLSGVPTALKSSPFPTGSDPLGLTIDPRGLYLYVANFGSSTISSFAINQATGGLSGVATSTASTDTGPTCISVEPALGIYAYSSNNTGNTITANQLDPHTGSLTQVQGTPFPAQTLPTCLVTVANGAHATQLVDKGTTK